MNFNITDNVRVKLNEKGLKILEQNNKLDLVDDGYINLSFVELMSIFGEHMKDSNDLPFDANVLVTGTKEVEIEDTKYDINTDELFDDLEPEIEEEINQVDKSSVELEEQQKDNDSIQAAVDAVSNELNLSFAEFVQLYHASANFLEFDQQVIENISAKARGISNEQVLNILSFIHNEWIKANLNEDSLEKNKANNELIRYMPLELVGWDEAKKELQQLKPVLDVLNIHVNEQDLHEAYLEKTANYISDNHLDFTTTQLDVHIVFDLPISNKLYSNETYSSISFNSDEIVEQIQNNFADDRKIVESNIQKREMQKEEPKISSEVIEQTKQIEANVYKFVSLVQSNQFYNNRDYTVDDIDSALLRLRAQVDEYSSVFGQVKTDDLMDLINKARQRIQQYNDLVEKTTKDFEL